MIIKINGKEENIIEGSTVLSVLEAKEVKPGMVAVELNGDLLEKEEFGEKSLKEGDILEFLHYMAGGKGGHWVPDFRYWIRQKWI